VVPCLMFNVFTIFGLLDAWGVIAGIEFEKEFQFVSCSLLVVALLLYYLHRGRYKRIVLRIEQKKCRMLLHPVIVVLLYYVVSVGLLFLAGLYKNRDWIFALE